MALFAGTIGMYKNQQSHRHVPTDGQYAAEVIVFASQLLRNRGPAESNEERPIWATTEM